MLHLFRIAVKQLFACSIIERYFLLVSSYTHERDLHDDIAASLYIRETNLCIHIYDNNNINRSWFAWFHTATVARRSLAPSFFCACFFIDEWGWWMDGVNAVVGLHIYCMSQRSLSTIIVSISTSQLTTTHRHANTNHACHVYNECAHRDIAPALKINHSKMQAIELFYKFKCIFPGLALLIHWNS